MTPEEAMDKTMTIMGIKDPFARIAVADLMRDLEKYEGIPATGSEHEKKMMELGQIAWEELGR